MVASLTKTGFPMNYLIFLMRRIRCLLPTESVLDADFHLYSLEEILENQQAYV